MKTDENKDSKLKASNNLDIENKKKVENKTENMEEEQKIKQEENKDKPVSKVNEKVKIDNKERIKKIRNVFFIVLFNLIFPYVIFLISNINNPLFFTLREVRRTAYVYNFSFMYELAMIYGLYFFFKAIFRKSLRSNIALAILLNIISIISYYKINAVAKPFWPEDILLIGNATEIAGYGNLHIESILIIQIFITIVVLLIQGLITKYSKYEGKLKNITRVIMGAFSIVTICAISLFNWTKVQGFEENDYNYKINYSIYGAAVEFFRNTYKLIEEPNLEIYSEERLEQIKEKSESLGSENIVNEDSPNIIVIMAESFSDITEVNLLEFEKDPLPTYRSLKENYPHGNIVASIYGGETSMSEFEFLTGSSTRFLEGKRYPYSQIIEDDTQSIIRTLKEQGYYTTSIHANGGEFYNRDKAYKYFGFDKMIFEDDMQDIDKVYDNNISDMDTAEEIIKQYENIQNSKKFIFAITKELHTPYNSTRYSEYEIEVKSKTSILDTEISPINVYTQGLYNFDKSLKYLVDYFEQKEEKVMLVLYGDHLPGFNNLYNAEYGDRIEKYETPYVIWTNYEMDQEEIEKYSKERISIAGLSMIVLEEANIQLPWYYNFINEFYKQYPVCTNKFLLDQDGNELSIETNNELIEDYNIIVFDFLYEKNIQD